jgi:hypothetical protein
MLAIVAVAASAAEPDTQLNGNTAEDTLPPEETLADEDTPPESGTEPPEESFVPPGTGTVIDYYIDADGKVFYTIMTADKHVFYLVIDHDRNSENVYFLKAVTIADLVALAEKPLPGITPPETTPPSTTPEQPSSSSSNMGIVYIVVGVVILGATVWYIRVYRPKQQASTNSSEYEPQISESASDDSDDWDDDTDEVDTSVDDEQGS